MIPLPQRTQERGQSCPPLAQVASPSPRGASSSSFSPSPPSDGGEGRAFAAPKRLRPRRRGEEARSYWIPLSSILFLAWTASARAASLTNAAALPPVAPDLGASFIRVLGALGIVVAILLGGAWLFRNWQRLALRRGRNPDLQVVEFRSLGQRHALYVVGYREQRLLLAASPNGVNLLCHLPTAEPAPAISVPATNPEGVDFTTALQQALRS